MDNAADRTIESLRWAHELGARKTSIEELPGGQLVLVSGEKIIDLEKYLDAPTRIRDEREFIEADGFAGYCKDFARPNTKYFASLKGQAVTAILDYDGPSQPSWRTHVAKLVSVKTAEWVALMGVCGQWLSQTAFAEWLEAYNHIVISPDSASLVEVAMNLHGSVEGRFQSTINRHNGSVVFSFSEETTTGQVRVPQTIQVSVAPFHYSALSDITVFLRFRIEQGKPRFQLAIPNAARVEQASLYSLFGAVSEGVGKPVLIGP